MKNIKILVLASFLIMIGLVNVFAQSYYGASTYQIKPTYLTALNGVQNTNGCNQVTAQSQLIIGLEISATSANTFGLFDNATAGSCTASTGVFEANIAANTSQYFDFSKSPIRIKNGLNANLQNGSLMTIYTVQQ